jgi:hypothetical protein
MPEYCIYTITDKKRHYFGPLRTIHCADDEKAIQAAGQYLDFHELEIWEHDRFIARLHPKEPTSA